MSDDSESKFSGDQPIADRPYDLLNRAVFADRIAELVDGLPSRTGLVIGVFGPWGSGKTTVLNLLRDKLRENDSILVRDFNPWRLTDEFKIFPSFFSVLSDAIKKRPTIRMGRLWALPLRWGRRALGPVTRRVPRLLKLWNPTVSEVTDELLKAFGAIVASPDAVALESQRNKIVCRLRRFDKRIVVLIDDIDRLDKRETQLLFRVIKACADFPNVTYILAFDEAMVAEAIGEQYGDGGEKSGRNPLEKIVQVPIELPMPARGDLRKLLLAQLDLVLKNTGLSLTEDQARDFLSSIDPVIGTRLTTPRDAKRLRNALMFAIPPLVGESHPVDLQLIEVVRALFPDVFSIVRSHHNDFAGIEGELRNVRDDNCGSERRYRGAHDSDFLSFLRAPGRPGNRKVPTGRGRDHPLDGGDAGHRHRQKCRATAKPGIPILECGATVSGSDLDLTSPSGHFGPWRKSQHDGVHC